LIDGVEQLRLVVFQNKTLDRSSFLRPPQCFRESLSFWYWHVDDETVIQGSTESIFQPDNVSVGQGFEKVPLY
jgi:hypothetical protein